MSGGEKVERLRRERERNRTDRQWEGGDIEEGKREI